MREIYASENGDRWFLIVDAADHPRIVHQPNKASGGSRVEFEVGAFLQATGRHLPQHQALLRLVASLAKKQAD